MNTGLIVRGFSLALRASRTPWASLVLGCALAGDWWWVRSYEYDRSIAPRLWDRLYYPGCSNFARFEAYVIRDEHGALKLIDKLAGEYSCFPDNGRRLGNALIFDIVYIRPMFGCGAWAATNRMYCLRGFIHNPNSSQLESSFSPAEVEQAKAMFITLVSSYGLDRRIAERAVGGESLNETAPIPSGYSHNAAALGVFSLLGVSLAWVPGTVRSWSPAARRARRLGRGQCPYCGYSLAGLTRDVCPECGCSVLAPPPCPVDDPLAPTLNERWLHP